ncbi:hypothetical protein EHS25_000608 [Saitozyma podzolica]|uniref:Sulfatase N-terminal domain-containing protein n=1 Tax=Saitozyma podzolica TaxID=1890683 RepID=A0A427YWT7_9TREE|nr:hypothetical protein EHS25_000608 [Saitozyma podzolica]
MTIHKRPNFLLILADDLGGYSDIGCYGSEIRTPNIDALARDGARMTDFHATAACSPTRAILLTGTDNHIAGVGCMSEMKASGGQRWNVKGHEGYLNHDVVALPELLQEAGYHTLISGKWHLGLKPENNPASRGFDRSLALLPGCSNHYGYEPQFGPDYLSFFERIPPLYSRDGKKADIQPNTTHAVDGFYSSDTYADNLLDYLQDWRQGAGEGHGSVTSDKPFFAYLPFSAPHWPLQCSKEDRDAYAGVYDDGPDALRLRRLESLKALGIYDDAVVPAEVIAPEATEWDEMSPQEKRLSARSMETYAGMVTSMDRAIGRVTSYLREIGELDSGFLKGRSLLIPLDTMVVFMSDNGAEGAAYEAMPVFGKELLRIINRYYDNSLDNVGNHDSFVWYGPRWAQAATAPHRLYKMFSTEGGLRVPFVIRYPGFDPTFQNGTLLRAFSTVADLCPTILDLAGVSHPCPDGQAAGSWRDRTVAGMRGKSWVRYFSGEQLDGISAIHSDDDPAFGWELFGRAALRRGKWKILHVAPAAGGRPDGKWQLYDMSVDPGEVNDLSEEHPDLLKDLLRQWELYVEQTGTVWGEDKLPIGAKGTGWNGTDENIIGGDALEQTRAWMRLGKNSHPVAAAPALALKT